MNNQSEVSLENYQLAISTVDKIRFDRSFAPQEISKAIDTLNANGGEDYAQHVEAVRDYFSKPENRDDKSAAQEFVASKKQSLGEVYNAVPTDSPSMSVQTPPPGYPENVDFLSLTMGTQALIYSSPSDGLDASEKSNILMLASTLNTVQKGELDEEKTGIVERAKGALNKYGIKPDSEAGHYDDQKLKSELYPEPSQTLNNTPVPVPQS